MAVIAGVYFDGKTSQSVDCTLHYTEDGTITLDCLASNVFAISKLAISARIGNTARYITLADGGQFETRDNNAVDLMNRTLGHTDKQSFLHYLESHKRYVVATLLVVVLTVFAAGKWGVPMLSKQIAMNLSPEVSKMIGEGAYTYMEKNWLKPSALSTQRKAQLTQRFKARTVKIQSDIPLSIKFHSSALMGANAFALPNGIIVFTDDLINLASDDWEIEAIMLHEIGHVLNRHSLRFALQQFGLTLLATTVTGDVSASSSFVVALPSLLTSQGYSRTMEAEADDYALKTMLSESVDPENFATMMEKLEAFYSEEFETCMTAEEQEKADKDSCLQLAIDSNVGGEEKQSSLFEAYLSTHPISKKRIERFRNARL